LESSIVPMMALLGTVTRERKLKLLARVKNTSYGQMSLY
jgi:hypothetical protein